SGAMDAGVDGAGCGDCGGCADCGGAAPGAAQRADEEAGAAACGARGEAGSACLGIGTPGLGATRRVRRVFRTG
ncbi:hypothetical protein NX871_32675, partial [Burkholderia thailandensis]|uniref:hypothetical protein n=1 Tax=Burkholderia thailandensis TaxID=57975 RepID=UPI00217DE2CF